MTKYTIKKGEHYSKPRYFGLYLNQKIVSFKFNFDESCFYSIADNVEYLDINKGFGFSFAYHMTSSIRVGWRPSATLLNQIDLFFFFHQDEKFTFEYFTTVRCGQNYQIDILNNFYANNVSFTLIGDDGFMILKSTTRYMYPSFRLGYILNFYFGGTLPAVQDM